MPLRFADQVESVEVVAEHRMGLNKAKGVEWMCEHDSLVRHGKAMEIEKGWTAAGPTMEGP